MEPTKEQNHIQENKKAETFNDLLIKDKGKLSGFFALLLKVDKRVNPDLYKLKK